MLYRKLSLFLVSCLSLLYATINCQSIGTIEKEYEQAKIGSVIAVDLNLPLDEFKDHRIFTYNESDVYKLMILDTAKLSQKFDFYIVKEVSRPQNITVNETNKYYDYYKILYFGQTVNRIQFCDTNAISYVSTDDTNALLLAATLSPVVKVDTLLTVDKINWQGHIFDENRDNYYSLPPADKYLESAFKVLDDTSALIISSDGFIADTSIFCGPIGIMIPRFNYRLSLGDSILAVGMDFYSQPQVNIFKIEDNYRRSKIHAITRAIRLACLTISNSSI
jgi:hypothetical protein